MRSTPATLTSRPEDVDRNAANAPAATSAPSAGRQAAAEHRCGQQQHRGVGLAGDEQLRDVQAGERADSVGDR